MIKPKADRRMDARGGAAAARAPPPPPRARARRRRRRARRAAAHVCGQRCARHCRLAMMGARPWPHTHHHTCAMMAARHAAAAVERTAACYMQLLYNAVHRRGQ
jgi:hypothetical protein